MADKTFSDLLKTDLDRLLKLSNCLRRSELEGLTKNRLWETIEIYREKITCLEDDLRMTANGERAADQEVERLRQNLEAAGFSYNGGRYLTPTAVEGLRQIVESHGRSMLAVGVASEVMLDLNREARKNLGMGHGSD
jgi:hypothetical protein